MASVRRRNATAPPGPSSIGWCLSFTRSHEKRPLCLRAEPARGVLSAQEEIGGDPGEGGDRERERTRDQDRAGDFAGQEEQHKRGEGKEETADPREEERVRGGKAGVVRRVASGVEVVVLDDARARRRQQLTRQVRGKAGLAPPPEFEPGQERPVHQRFGGNSSEPKRKQQDDLPGGELGKRVPHLFVVDGLGQQPSEHDDERSDHQHGSEQAPPERSRTTRTGDVSCTSARAHSCPRVNLGRAAVPPRDGAHRAVSLAESGALTRPRSLRVSSWRAGSSRTALRADRVRRQQPLRGSR